MGDPRGEVARMPPLPKPVLQEPAQPDQGAVESNVALAAHQGHYASGHDVSEARRAQQVDNPKQGSTLDEPECRLCGRLNRVRHNVLSLPITLADAAAGMRQEVVGLSNYYVVLYLNIP
jgi:hypothetical protein